jgi:hypothetical protein
MRNLAAVTTSALLLAACAGGGSPPSTTSTPTTTPSARSSAPAADPAHPVGLVALGHSGMTGFQSDPANPDTNAPANSWATGTNPAVGSIYQRMVAALPETSEHVANVSRNGEKADGLEFQVDAALAKVPTPRLALIQIMDNDIRCDGTDAAHLPEFRAQVRSTVQKLVATSPGIQVVLVTGAGRPDRWAAAVAKAPTTPEDLIGSDPCVLFSAPHRVNRAEVRHLTALMEQYEAELGKACQGIPQCHTDGGAASHIQDTIEDYGVDLQHNSVLGHNHIAAAVWPVVAQALGLN